MPKVIEEKVDDVKYEIIDQSIETMVSGDVDKLGVHVSNITLEQEHWDSDLLRGNSYEGNPDDLITNEDKKLSGWINANFTLRVSIDDIEQNVNISARHERHTSRRHRNKIQHFRVYFTARLNGNPLHLEWVECWHEHMGTNIQHNVSNYYFANGWDRMKFASRNTSITFKFKNVPVVWKITNMIA